VARIVDPSARLMECGLVSLTLSRERRAKKSTFRRSA